MKSNYSHIVADESQWEEVVNAYAAETDQSRNENNETGKNGLCFGGENVVFDHLIIVRTSIVLDVSEHGSDRGNRGEQRNDYPKKKSQEECFQVEREGNGKMKKRREDAKKEDVESLRLIQRSSCNEEDYAADDHREESILEDLRQDDHPMWDYSWIHTQPFPLCPPCSGWFGSRPFDCESGRKTH